MSRLIKRGELSTSWPPYLGFNKNEITDKIEALKIGGMSLEEAFATVLHENSIRAATQLRQHLESNINFLNDKIESLTK